MAVCIQRILIQDGGTTSIETITPHAGRLDVLWELHNGQTVDFAALCRRVNIWVGMGYSVQVVTTP